MASRVMLAAHQQREIVDIFREKQFACHQKAEAREEQKMLDEFAVRRPSLAQASQLHSIDD
jgi:flagellar export protein FliJ